MSHRFLADPGSLVYDGRVYLYTSNDDDNNGAYQMHSVVCVSSSDLKNWTDHGIVFRVPADASWAGMSWAPQPIARQGKIFLYFGNNASGVGVASSSNPVSGFKDAKGSYLVNGSTPGAAGTSSWLFDPGALIDDDGQAYLSFGGNGVNNGRIIKLGTDLASVVGSAAAVSTTSFFEASFLFKRSNTYYFAFSTNPANGMRIDYLMSKSPMTGYTYGGIIADNPPSNGNNNHASEFEFKGSWYHAYHNRYVANQTGVDPGYKRNLGLEVLNFEADGKIKQVTYTTDGVPQLGQLNPYERVEAETMNAQSGIETETSSEGGMDVTAISNGDWIRVRGVDFGSSGATSFSARVASAAAGGSIELRLGSATGTLVGTCAVPATGGAQSWKDVTCDVSGATGVKDLYLKFSGSGFNVNYWQFTPTDGGNVGNGSGGASNQGGASNPGGASSAGAHTGGADHGGSVSNGGKAAGGSSAGGSASGGAQQAGGAQTGSGGSGTMGSGGRSAAGGSESAAGGAATGGSSSSAGSVGVPQSGGAQGAAGSSTSAGSAAVGGGASSDAGCSCRIGAQRSSSGLASLGLVSMLGLLVRRSRRRSRTVS